MIKTTQILAAIGFGVLLSLAVAPAGGQQLLEAGPGGTQSPSLFDEPEILADETASREAGFKTIQTGDWPSDDRTAMIREKFVEPLANEAGASIIGITDYALFDLNGDGYSDLILFPRIVDAKSTFSENQDGPRVVIFTFNGERWTRALDSFALEVGYKQVDRADGSKQYEIALIHGVGFDRYTWDGERFVVKK